jgi:hypothetical protein
MDYNHLRGEYSETVSMEQLYQICHISKRKALWLLEHGVIPCEDSGKQTRRFSIRLDDVIDFLRRRYAGELDDVIPHGAFSSGGHETAEILDSEDLSALLLDRWEDAPDALTASEAEALCGYGDTTLNRWLKAGRVQGVTYRGGNLFSKESLAAFLASNAGQRISVKSELHREAIEDLREQQNSGMGMTMSL